ncbi:MAG: arginine repressor [Oscillospiraceae bacterium]|nr:arginine repressor [Oscillospiraceae bacterium]
MKKKRHELILNFVKNNNVSTQEEIITMLADNGFNVTQATISRDIKELKLVKEHFGKNDIRYAISEKNADNDNFRMIFTNSVLSIEAAMNIIVVKCYSGTANAACIALDGMDLPGIVGTIAGDDTIFVACKDTECASDIISAVSPMLKG